MNRKKLLGYLVSFFLTTTAFTQDTIFKSPERGFVSWLPAPAWEHALLSGNGTMGALVMGHPHEETILLSHALLYAPQKRSANPFPQATRLDEIRKLILEGKYAEATRIPVAIRKEQNYYDERDPFIPAFDIRIDQQPGNIHQYNRSVNFQTGETAVNWTDANGTFQRKLFVSRADSLIVLSIKGTGKINCTIRFAERTIEWAQWKFINENIRQKKASAEGEWLSYSSTFKNTNEGGLLGYEGLGKLVLKKGTSSVAGNRIIIQDAEEVLLFIRIEPKYAARTYDLKEKINAHIQDYTTLLAAHASIHGKLFNRMKLDLGGSASDRSLNTEELLLKAKQGVPTALIEKLFDAGRYNILSATGTNPPNLQGLWSGTWTAPWAGSMTNDGNLPAAMSIVLPGNMPELMETYVSYHERLLPQYKKSAETLYGCRGIHVPAQQTTSGWETDFGETWCLTFWTGGAGWTAGLFFDYFQYTGDKEFLRRHAYPFMKEAALFYEDFLSLDKNGKYIFNPSYSPENNPGNSSSQAVLNATMDIMIAKQLLRNCIKAATLLNVDPTSVAVWKNMLTRMPAYEVNPDGTLREWLWSGLEENNKHRHASHLYALFDEIDPDFKNNPVLQKAASRSLEERLKFRANEEGGEMAFGLSHLGLVATHLGDKERAHQILGWLSKQYWSTGLGSFHNVGDLFNTDISGTVPYQVTQMLAYSEVGMVSLLPALPPEWSVGKIQGLLLRGQVEITEMTWSTKEINLILRSGIRQSVLFKLPTSIKNVSGNAVKIQADKKGFTTNLPANELVDITIVLE